MAQSSLQCCEVKQFTGETAAGTEKWNLLVIVKALNERLKRRAESQDCVMSFTNIQRFESQPRRASSSVDCAGETDETGPREQDHGLRQ